MSEEKDDIHERGTRGEMAYGQGLHKTTMIATNAAVSKVPLAIAAILHRRIHGSDSHWVVHPGLILIVGVVLLVPTLSEDSLSCGGGVRNGYPRPGKSWRLEVC
jgi:hypothetical protein